MLYVVKYVIGRGGEAQYSEGITAIINPLPPNDL
jgi:hypothetical protein